MGKFTVEIGRDSRKVSGLFIVKIACYEWFFLLLTHVQEKGFLNVRSCLKKMNY